RSMRKILSTALLALTAAAIPLSVQAEPAAPEKALAELRATKERIDAINTRTFETNWFLNRGFLFDGQLAAMRSLEPGADAQNTIQISPLRWQGYWLGSQKAQIAKTLPPGSPLALIDEYATEESTVPVGVLRYTGEWLKADQISALASRARPSKALGDYEKLGIFAGAVLEKSAVGPDVTFVLDERLFMVDGAPGESVHIDLGDGEGFRNVAIGEHFTARYAEPGVKEVAVRFESPDGPVITRSALDVFWVPGREPVWQIELQNPGIDVSARPEAAQKNLQTGGTLSLWASDCDRVFDKPVLVVEGFDPLDNRGHPKIYDLLGNSVRNYFSDNGYDVLTLNFDFTGASAQHNARVVEEALAAIRRMQVGSEPIAVIGASMGGVVSRYALADMERRGRAHHVDLFVALDSPFRGANIQIGMQEAVLLIGEMLENSIILNALNIDIELIDRAVATLADPFPQQILLVQPDGDLTEFNAFQQALDNLGWPSQSRNVSLVSGSLDGRLQAPWPHFVPGNDLLRFALRDPVNPADWLETSIQATIRSPQINQATTVASLRATVLGINVLNLNARGNYGPFNYDYGPGGSMPTTTLIDREGSWTPLLLDLSDYLNAIHFFEFENFAEQGREAFSFVPLHSAVDSSLPVTQQGHLERSLAQHLAGGNVPFDAVYGTNQNHVHAEINSAFEVGAVMPMLEAELPRSSCSLGTMPPPPAPVFYGDDSVCFNDGDGVRYSLFSSWPSQMYGFHRTTWTLTDSGGTVRFRKDSRDVTIPTLDLPVGSYQVRAQRGYWPQLNGPSRSSSRTLQVLAPSHPSCAQVCPGPGSGGGGGDGFPGNGDPTGTLDFCP
ncbi:MAG: hypothetical protein AAFX50_02665, partial [Acidobacteriota bacterium]